MATLTATALNPRRLVIDHLSLTIEGRTLEDVQLGGWVYGPELGTAPAVLIVGGITASPFPFGDGQSSGEDPRAAWWPALCAPDLIDPAKYTVLCPSWPGNGSTWKGFDDPNSHEFISVAGLADLVAAWLDGCGCKIPVTWVGASLGGMVGVVFAARHPERCAKLIAISAGLRPDGWGTATRHLQRELVRDGLRNGDVTTGMMRARQLGMLTYRGRDELDTRFGKLLPHLERPPVAEYLDHHGRRFAERFPVKTFLLLSESIDRESMGDAQAVRDACARVNAETIVVGVPGDMLFPWALQVELHRALQAAGADSSLWKLESLFGHDAFLADQDRLADLLRGAEAFGKPLKTASRPRFEGVGVEPVREIRIGLVGCGTVGGGLLEMIDRQSDAIADRYGVKFRVSRIAVRDVTKNRGPRVAGIPITDRGLELVSDPEVDVVVEAAGGTSVEPILVAALAAGKPVVTANKELLASKLAELGVLAQRTETPLYCEAAAAAAIPIVRHLSHRADEVDSLWGIVNATCNFIMTRLEQGDLTLAEAIEEAQRLGFAEADPTADIDGLDAAAKLSILAYRAFGAWVRPDGFLVRGIRDIDPADCDLAESMGFRIRQIARAVRINGGLDMAVEPLLLPSWHLLASVEEEYNAVYLRCVSSGDLSLFGKGAGALPTATAMLGDLIDLAQDNSVRWPVPHALPVAKDGTSVAPAPRRHYLRVTGQPHPGLERKFEGLVRRLGLVVQNRATRSDHDRVDIAFMVSPGTDSQIAEVVAAVRKAGKSGAAHLSRSARLMPGTGRREPGTASRIDDWLDPSRCPSERPPFGSMSQATRELHDAIDAHARRSGVPYLHPDEPTVQLDLLGSKQVIEWQEGKAAFLFASEGCWSELPALYARYGTNATAALIATLKALEQASAALVCDSGMQATALAFDALMEPGGHAILMRQVYNKTRSYLEWMAARVGGSVTIVDDGDMAALGAAIKAETRFVFAETFTNPLVRAQDFDALRTVIDRGRSLAPALRLVLDTTIASPWAFKVPPLQSGVDIIVASGTKSLGGNDRDMWGYIATNDTQFANAVMDLIAMRGGILDWRRATAVASSFDGASESHARRSATAARIASFLDVHPKVSEVFHPSLPNHRDRAAIDKHYSRFGSLLSFRIKDADDPSTGSGSPRAESRGEDRTRHYADVLATTVIVRYALSFDGLATKVNHHRTVSEYFTALDQLKRNGFDRLIRLAVGLEHADDLIAALNWTLHHGGDVTVAEIEQWQRERANALGM